MPNKSTPWGAMSLGLFLCVIAVHIAIGTQVFTAPGLYLDAVNPDYLAVRITDPSSPTSDWMLPGNLLSGRFPLLSGGWYCSSLMAYMTLPFYLAFGGTVLSIRLAHLFAALIIITVSFEAVRGTTRSGLIAAIAVLPLATDPGFVFPFRTQAFVTTFPVIFAILGIYLLANSKTSPSRYLAAGFFLGFSAWGYFIYAFMYPGALLFVATNAGRRKQDILWASLLFGTGITLGLVPYLVSFTLLFRGLGGLIPGVQWLQASIGTLHVATDQTLAERILSVLTSASWALTGEWFWKVVWGLNHPDTWQDAKIIGLLLLPLAAAPFSFGNGTLKRMFRLMGLCMISYLIVATVFGGRLGGYHFILLLPMLYVLAGVSGAILVNEFGGRLGQALSFAGAAVLVVNVVGSQAIVSHLKADGGAAFYSPIVNQYPLEEVKRGDKTPHIFMEWGGLLQFIYLTEGKIPAYDGNWFTSWGHIKLAMALCQYSEAKLVFIGPGATARGLSDVNADGLQKTSVETLYDNSRFKVEYAVIGIKRSDEVCKQ